MTDEGASVSHRLFRQVADLRAENERLRAENERLNIVTDEQVMLIEHQEAEIERLRGRLDASEEAAAAHHAEWKECESIIAEQKDEIERLRKEVARRLRDARRVLTENESLKAQLDASYAGRWG